MNKKTTVNWAILGAGKIAKKFATDLTVVTNAQKYAVASRSFDKATSFSKEFGFEKSYGSYEEMVKDPHVDAVYIAVPHTHHATATKLCLEHGKAVLCEKPFAMHANEVEEMISIAQSKKVLLMEAMWTYFLPHYQYVLNFLKNETFGSIKSLEADFGFVAELDPSSRLLNKSLGGGGLLDIGIYPIFAALSILGMPKKINATAQFFETGADSVCEMNFQYNNDIVAKLKSTLLEKTATEATIVCENGTVLLNSRFHEPSTVTLKSNDGTTETLDFDYTTIGYNFEVAHFGSLLLEGATESPIMNFELSRKLIQLLDTVRSEIGLQYDI
ncbi:Predicted dehydrogenase [Pustulibacterium marinum]|uniref:Predicted dehydrogenase n=1 Tax=Pustulibacterium marinum TaxID=1224947 RepID=A0A1I7FTS2_9FLAO|nr:Gfo/Idh/MocA family oxidoreductase [Pustulibacterium marinum]SFU39558.1 Predicted dehydrogenase [Pustulibacterium marinum]